MDIVGSRNLRKVLEQKVRAHPKNTFLIFEDNEEKISTYSYKEFDNKVNQTANALISLGVNKGDKVNLHLTNCPEFMFCWFGIAKIGAVMVPTNPLSPPDELKYPVHHSESVITITQPDLLPNVLAIRKECPYIQNVLVIGEKTDSKEARSFNKEIENQPEQLADIPIEPLDDAAILYTSGTTSLPKGVRVTHANYVFLGEAISKSMRLGPTDRHLVTLPLFHANAQYYSFMTTLTVGASAALTPRFSASRFMKQATRHKCTVTSLFAAPMRMILAQPRDDAEGDNSFRLIIFAQSVTQEQLKEWESRFNAPLLQIYGMTETMGQPLVNPLDYTRDNMSIGFPALGYECRVVDSSGKEVGEDIPGELIVKGTPGSTIMKGYFKDEKATKNTLKDGWLWTGDVVSVNEDGYFSFVDRTKDMIKRAGENIAAGEVESVIKQYPGVSDATVIGIPDEMRDESIKAFVILDKGATVSGDEIIDYCKERMSKFRIPEFVEFRDDVPRTSVGKVQKHLLRQEEESKRKNP